MSEPIERLADLTDPGLNRIYNMSVEAARAIVDGGDPAAIRGIDGSFALVARSGKRVRMARSIDRPLRYFIAKRHEGPCLVVADRISTIHDFLRSEGLDDQFQTAYTRMVPAHYLLEIQLLGCPDPNPTYTRFFTPRRDSLPTDLDEIGGRYIGALAEEIGQWRGVPDHRARDAAAGDESRPSEGVYSLTGRRSRPAPGAGVPGAARPRS